MLSKRFISIFLIVACLISNSQTKANAETADHSSAFEGVWRGTANIGQGTMGIDVTIISSDANEFSGYVDLYPIGRGFSGVFSCSSFVGNRNDSSGEMALRSDPDPRVVAAADGAFIRTMIMAGTVRNKVWSGRFDWLDLFHTFTVSKISAPAIRKPQCRQTAKNLTGRRKLREALLDEKEVLLSAMKEDNAVYRSIISSSPQESCLVQTLTDKETREELIFEGLKSQLFKMIPGNGGRLLEAGDWLKDFAEANRDGEPMSLSAKIAVKGFLCFANATTGKRIELFTRRIAQMKRLQQIDAEISAL